MLNKFEERIQDFAYELAVLLCVFGFYIACFWKG
jgi:hypothetical protein